VGISWLFALLQKPAACTSVIVTDFKNPRLAVCYTRAPSYDAGDNETRNKPRIMFYMYVLKSLKDGELYIGSTKDLRGSI